MTRGLRLPSTLDSINFVDTVMERLMRPMGFDDDTIFYTSLAVREAAIDACKYGNKWEPTKTLGLMIEYTDSAITVYVSDESTEEFDLRPYFNLNPDVLLPNGRGIFLMHAYIDEPPQVEYERSGGRIVGRRIKLVKYRPLLLPDEC